MKLHGIGAERRPDGVRFTGTVEKQNPAETAEVYFDFTSPHMLSAEPNADAFAAAMLIPAMRGNEPLEIVPPISPRLHLQLPRIRDLFHTWYPEFARIDIRTTPAAVQAPPAAGTATFFSGGVDSFYTLLKYRSGSAALPRPLTHLIFMRGVETKLERSKGVSDSELRVREIAEQVGVGIVTGETNYRTALQGPEDYIHWEKHYHGSALAAVGLALSPLFGIVCIPSAFNYNHLVRHGSSPLLDEMFSTERTNILHDGAEAARAEKVGKIVEWNRKLVLDQLRVCHFNHGGEWNCGKCAKCVRTAVPLAALRLLEGARLFETTDKTHWSRALSNDHPVLIRENIDFVQRNGADPELLSILNAATRLRISTERRRKLKGWLKPIAGPLYRSVKPLIAR